jgi:hypothetical protein
MYLDIYLKILICNLVPSLFFDVITIYPVLVSSHNTSFYSLFVSLLFPFLLYNKNFGCIIIFKNILPTGH